jgi:phosphatidylethanolamine N-methyltransferase
VCRAAAYTFAAAIFAASAHRDWLFAAALQRAPVLAAAAPAWHEPAGYALMAVGMGLVLAAFARLGIVGTYLGDYCGVLMAAPVTGFPYNAVPSPMYTGATLGFLALAWLAKSPVGLGLTLFVHVVYRVACRFEDSFTAHIYAQAAATKQGKKQS